VYCLSLSAEAWALLGCPDQGRRRIHEALRLAQAHAPPLRLAIVFTQARRLSQLRRERPALQACTEAVLTVATEHGFPTFIAVGPIMRGWGLAEQGQRTAGSAQIRQGLIDERQTGAEASVGHSLGLLAEGDTKGDQPEEGLTVLAEAQGLVQQTASRIYESALYRLQGELRLARSQAHATEAETCCRQALDIARRQQAQSWELRAAMSRARLWQQQGKHTEARELLAPIYGWFTAGFDTADLQDAKALLEALA
jgi:predicted ATPase